MLILLYLEEILFWNTLISTIPKANFNMDDTFDKNVEVEGVNRMWVHVI
ncbi:MAG: hypothetical protein JNL75_11880 [Chitinophagales bacterium]|nr:hypothetical protein [Chitinophagales bacterium]